MKSKLLAISAMALFPFMLTGCCRALPIVSTTPVPGEEFKVLLGGPATDGTFCYYLCSSDGESFRTRDLGKLHQTDLTPSFVESLGDHIYRIQWGNEQTGQFAIFDTKQMLYLTDSNPENIDEETFLRPKQF